MPKKADKPSPLDDLTPQELPKALRALQHAKTKTDQALAAANKALKVQYAQRDHRAAELLIANKELVLESAEKEKRLAEIVELKETQLFAEQQRFEKTLLSIGDGVISTDANRNVLFMNRVAENLTGWSKAEAIGQPIYTVFNIIDEYTREIGEDIIDKVFTTKTIHNLSNHTILITKDKTEKLIEDSAAPLLSRANDVIGVVVVFRDYSEKWERLKQIEYMNLHDDLTGLYNRRFFEEQLAVLDVPANLPLGVIMGDINGLKLVNDSFGHPVGDDLLKETAKSLRVGCLNDEIIARLGEDEFAIILPQCTQAQCEAIIERIQADLKTKTVQQLELSVSFGYGIKTDSKTDLCHILKETEDFMYRHKVYEGSSMRSHTIDLVSKTLFAKSARELTHSQRVSDLSVKLSTRLGHDHDRINQVKVVGLLHDIGKIGIDEKILNKTGFLDSDEYIEIKKHPEIGSRILSSVIEFADIAMAVLQHHERWDGAGYPQGLKGEAITIEARIIALADTYDAITSERTYRQRRSKAEALTEILACSGKQFDPHMAQEFIAMVNEDQGII
jgi:diguanylate cyclase (GGDEF)-like protein/PAS domain S-box-containing protein